MNAVIATIATGVVARATLSLFNLGAAAGETASKFSTVFGESADQVQQFLDTFGVLGGLSRTQGREIAATTGAIAQGMGFAEQASADFATQVVRLAADIGSFNNLPTEDVIRRINAALTGERESLKRLGIVILETDVQTRALSNTGKAHADQLTQQEKVTATLQLITERAGRANGDLERTQNSMANTARRVVGQLVSLRDLAGEVFVSTIQLAGGIGGASTQVQAFSGWLTRNRETIQVWGVFVIKTVGFVISVFRNLVRVVFNVGEIIGHTLDVTFSDLFDRMKAVLAVLIAGVTRDVGMMRSALRQLVLPEGSVERFSRWRASVGEDLGDIADAAGGTAQALAGMAVALEQAMQVTRGEIRLSTPPVVSGVTPPELDRPGREENAQRAIRELRQQADDLLRSFNLGRINTREFREELGRLAIQFKEAEQSGRFNESQVLDLAEAMQGLQERAAEIPRRHKPISVVKPNELELLVRIGKQLHLMVGEINLVNDSVQNLADGFSQGFSEAFTDAFSLLGEGSKEAALAFQAAFLRAIAAVAQREGQLFLAKGIGAIGTGLLGDPKGFAAAAKFFAAAAAMFALSGAIGAAAVRGGGGGGGGREGAERTAEDFTPSANIEGTVVIEGGLLDMSDPRQADALARAVETLVRRRATRVSIRVRG